MALSSASSFAAVFGNAQRVYCLIIIAICTVLGLGAKHVLAIIETFSTDGYFTLTCYSPLRSVNRMFKDKNEVKCREDYRRMQSAKLKKTAADPSSQEDASRFRVSLRRGSTGHPRDTITCHPCVIGRVHFAVRGAPTNLSTIPPPSENSPMTSQ